MSFIGKLFGSDQALGKIVDTAKDLVDESFYTDQEQAEDKAKAGEAASVHWLSLS
jgi:hypothetical protein